MYRVDNVLCSVCVCVCGVIPRVSLSRLDAQLQRNDSFPPARTELKVRCRSRGCGGSILFTRGRAGGAMWRTCLGTLMRDWGISREVVLEIMREFRDVARCRGVARYIPSDFCADFHGVPGGGEFASWKPRYRV